MKRIYIIAILTIMCSLAAMAQDKEVVNHQTTGRDRFETTARVSLPTINYDSDNQLIIIAWNCSANQYDVIITSKTTLETVLTETVYGPYGEIDVTGLDDDSYEMTLVASGAIIIWNFEKGGGNAKFPDSIGFITPNTSSNFINQNKRQ